MKNGGFILCGVGLIFLFSLVPLFKYGSDVIDLNNKLNNPEDLQKLKYVRREVESFFLKGGSVLTTYCIMNDSSKIEMSYEIWYEDLWEVKLEDLLANEEDSTIVIHQKSKTGYFIVNDDYLNDLNDLKYLYFKYFLISILIAVAGLLAGRYIYKKL